MAVKKATNNNDELQKQIEDLKNTVALLVNAMSAKATEEKVTIQEVNDYDYTNDIATNIPDNKYIKVISLENNPMILSTGGMGKGKVYEFEKFGQSRNITYNNLVEILSYQEHFAKQGRFYILDKDVINNHELSDAYKSILTKEQIENILTYDEKAMTTLFNRTTPEQRETIVSLVINKLKDGEKVDLNKVSILSKIYGFDLTQSLQLQEQNRLK